MSICSELVSMLLNVPCAKRRRWFSATTCSSSRMRFFLGQQGAGRLDIAQHEHAGCQMEVIEHRWCISEISRRPSAENVRRFLIFLAAISRRLLSRMSPMCSRLMVNARMSERLHPPR